MSAVEVSPHNYDAVIFDLDGVVTDTAKVHAAAWRQTFDDHLSSRPGRVGEDHRPFTSEDYVRFVDGKPRYEGVESFLTARGIAADHATVHALGEQKDRYFLELLARDGVEVFPSTVALAKALKAGGLRIAVISASRNCAAVLVAAGLDDLFDVRVEGMLADQLGLPGKPHPAVFLEAAIRLGVRPHRAVVVEDSLAGVAAGRRGGFALVIGVDRTGHREELLEHGADVVVGDLAEVAVAPHAATEVSD